MVASGPFCEKRTFDTFPRPSRNVISIMKFRMEMLSGFAACGKCGSRTSVSEKTRPVSLPFFFFFYSIRRAVGAVRLRDRTEFSSPVDKSDIDVTIFEITRLSLRRLAAAMTKSEFCYAKQRWIPTGFETSVKMSSLI